MADFVKRMQVTHIDIAMELGDAGDFTNDLAVLLEHAEATMGEDRNDGLSEASNRLTASNLALTSHCQMARNQNAVSRG